MVLSKNCILHLLTKTFKNFFFIFFSVVLFSGISGAQSEEEMKILQMFFKEKEITSVTRSPKPISQIAENITIVTAKEIEAMNAHTVAEVLNRVTGLFINFNQGVGSFGSTSILHIQGSEDRHVLVLVDGIPWNFLSSGAAETNPIPVGIIERIEIIKGPASAYWGSSLGGVVHIVTKSPGFVSGPSGTMRGSYGEHETQDYRAEISGREGRFGYYFFGGRQDSDGPDDSRYFENNSFFSKLSYAPSNRMDLGFSIGYSEPEFGLGDYRQIDIMQSGELRTLWGTAMLDAYLTRDLTFNLRFFSLSQESTLTNEALGLGFAGTMGELFQENEFEEQTIGATAKLVWKKGMHNAVFGVDFSSGDLDQTIDSGRVLRAMGAPVKLETYPDIERVGIYLNDTIVFDRLSITPGIRYDYNSITDSFVSPSLGITYKLGKETILRGSVARGFTAPPLSWTSGGALFLDPNPSLEEERVWSYQAGFESAALRYVWLKGTLFRHEIDEVFERTGSDEPGSMNQRFINGGESRRQGFEFEAETLPFYNTSLRAGVVYVDLDPKTEAGATEIYGFNIAVTYDDPDVLRAEIFGNYIWWDADNFQNLEYDDFIWDLNVSKTVKMDERFSIDLFLTGHNLFNGSHYTVADNKNPERWLEAGLRMKF